MTTSAASLAFRPDLQGLRAVAILLVVAAHAGVPWFAGGFVGVDVFFVLSGYLITGLLVREFHAAGRIALLRFYARRLRRLLPALVVTVAVMATVAYWLLSPFEAQTQLASAPFAATWTSNLYFLFGSVDYFDELAARDLFLHTWSLGVEEQFYLLWPLLLLALLFIGPLGRTVARRGLALALLSIVALASLGVSLYLSNRWPQAAFYLMPARIWQFALGAGVYLAFAEGKVRPGILVSQLWRIARPMAWLALAAGLLLILGSAAGLHAGVSYPGYWVLLPSMGAALVIASGHGLADGRGGPLGHPVMVWVGDRSYSWYLWHWPVLMLGFSLGLEGLVAETLGLVLLSLGAAIISYRYVELPFWKGRLSHGGALRVVLVSLLAMALLVAALVHALGNPREIAEAPADPTLAW